MFSKYYEKLMKCYEMFLWFSKIIQNSYSIEHFQTTASELMELI